jgi:hypothetical protein
MAPFTRAATHQERGANKPNRAANKPGLRCRPSTKPSIDRRKQPPIDGGNQPSIDGSDG